MAKEDNYLRWLAEETPTAWWNDSGDPDEWRHRGHNESGADIQDATSQTGCLGAVAEGLGKNIDPSDQAEARTRGVATIRCRRQLGGLIKSYCTSGCVILHTHFDLSASAGAPAAQIGAPASTSLVATGGYGDAAARQESR